MESRFLTDDDKTMQTSAKKDTKEEGKLDWHEQKKLAAKKRKIENEYQKTEQEIETLETDIANLDEELMRPEYACNAHKLNELSTAREEKETCLLYTSIHIKKYPMVRLSPKGRKPPTSPPFPSKQDLASPLYQLQDVYKRQEFTVFNSVSFV